MSIDIAGRPVLIVEDDDDIRSLLRRRVERWPYEIDEAMTGEEALELASRRPPILVMLDILLPGIDGWEVLAQFRADIALRDVPVAVVSIVDDHDDSHPPVQGYLRKPFHTADVDDLLSRLLPARDQHQPRAANGGGGP